MINPYPEFIGDVVSGRPLRRNVKHTIWQKGWDAREVVTKELYEACKRVWESGFNVFTSSPTLSLREELANAIAHYEEGK